MRRDRYLRPHRTRGPLQGSGYFEPVRVWPAPPEWDPEPAGEGQAFERHWHLLWARKRLLIATALLCAATAFFIAHLQTPIYRASASLEFQGFNEKFMNLGDIDPIATPQNMSGDTELQTQVSVLRSRSVLAKAISELKLDRFHGAPPPLFSAAALGNTLGLGPAAPVSNREQILATAEDDLKVDLVRGSRVIQITYSSPDPKLAAAFVNTLAKRFIDQQLELRLRSTAHTREWLENQLANVRGELQSSQRELQAYSQTTGLVFTGENDNAAERKLSQIQDELAKVQAERMDKQSRYEAALNSPPDSVPDTLDRSAIREYQLKLNDLRQRFAEARALLTPAHYKVKQLQAQINEVENAIEKERTSSARRMDNELSAARRREQLLAAAFSQQSAVVAAQRANAVRYNMLKREVDTKGQLYQMMLQKVKEAGVASAMRASNIALIDPAEPPTAPYKPKRLLNALVGLVSGFLAAAIFVFARERADRSFRNPGDTAVHLNVPELGVIPSDSPATRTQGPDRRRGLLDGGALLPPRDGAARILPIDPSSDGVEVVTWRHPPSVLAEAFRAALTSIVFGNRRPPRLILITSPGAREGKTTAVSNLGIVLARTNQRVLLIDADMRRPRLHSIFHVPNTAGLSELLSETDPPEGRALTLVQPTDVPNLFVLTSGSPESSPSELLYVASLSELLRMYRRNFDMVLIDAPPVLLPADSRLLGRLADGVILVCRAGRTSRDQAAAAAARLTDDGIPIIGTILNDWEPDGAAPNYYSYMKAR